MKFFVAFFFCTFSFTTRAVEAQIIFKGLEGFREIEGLPPKLEATFRIACHQSFLELIRYDADERGTNKKIIALGALVEDQRFNCDADDSFITVSAGHTYSGRDYEIVSIR